jgi:hypothetical protein
LTNDAAAMEHQRQRLIKKHGEESTKWTRKLNLVIEQ